ncbi:MAG: substrate-binding domain-containing protein, partial [Acidimicrobiales bacterium]
ALQVIEEAGLALPDDIAVVGFDEIVWAPLLRTGLTTVGQPAYDLGHESARLLLSRIQGYSGSARTVLLPTTLNIRASSAPRSGPLKATAGPRPTGLPLRGAGPGRRATRSRRSGGGG